MKAQLKQSRGAKRYTNVEQEGPPIFPGDIPVSEHADIPEVFEPSDDEPEREDTPPTPTQHLTQGKEIEPRI